MDASSAPPELDVTVVLPAYNEAGHVREEIDRISAALKDTAYSFEILVVDDGSTDGTADVVEGLPFVRLLRVPVNRGSGTARRIAHLAGTRSALRVPSSEVRAPTT